jgi:2-polyprenyl-3-methyl-5-hydroxy-6-metoxy-1,4-benzoquinol methylase
MTEATRPSTDWVSRVRTVWNGRAQEWDQMAEVNALAEDRTAEIARLAFALDLHHGSTLLDAGCGTGQWAIAFATLGCDVTAQDLAPAMVDRAQAHARDRGVSISFRTADISTLPDANGTYDAIHARAVLLFVPDPPAVLREFRRVLKPGGRIFVSVPGALSPIYNRSWRRFVEPANVGSTFMLPWELQALLEDGGWRVLEQWGNYGQNLMGAQNEFAEAVRDAPMALQQAAATIWGFVAV